ncbi:MAG: hypothetical protein JST28_11965 [Acidobacteria bacterium]|nr:hypothetical protein [Acidobacteriota bacterium]
MKRATSMMAGMLLAVLIAGGAAGTKSSAQSVSGEVFTVPFAFTADGHEVEPGTYEVRRDSSQFVMSIQNVKTGEKQLFPVRPESRPAVHQKGLLVFQQCGDRKSLSEFHVRGTSLYSATVTSGRKRNFEVESCSRPETLALASR